MKLKKQKKTEKTKQKTTKLKKMKLTVSKKLIGGFLVVLLLLAALAGMSIVQIGVVDSTYSNLIDDRVEKVVIVKDVKLEVQKQSDTVARYLLTGETSYLDEYKKSIDSYNSLMTTLESSLNQEEAKEIFKHLSLLGDKFVDLANNQIDLKKQGKEAEYLAMIRASTVGTGQAYIDKADELVAFEEDLLQQASKETTQKVESVKAIILIISIAAFVLGMIVAYIISRQISKPVVLASQAIERIAQGDLTVEEIHVKNRDEIGTLLHSLNRMVKDLREVIQNVYDSSNQVAASSEELMASAEQSTKSSEFLAQLAQESAEGADIQLRSVNEVAVSIQETAAGLNEIGKSSEEMSDSSETAIFAVKKGSDSISKVVNQMNHINTSVNETEQVIQTLGQKSQEIENILSMIKDIADQTNLLALNAAIEAARAGEHGRGFAVVADEVRKLAEESKTSVETITSIIGEIQSETDNAIKSMKSGSNMVHLGLQYTSETETSFSEINQSIVDVTAKVQEVAASIEEMTAVSTQISSSSEKVKEIAEKQSLTSQDSAAQTEEQLATMEEVTSSAQNLAVLAEQLQMAVSRFKI
ncbi:methyl-accepting chemotaxis protein [Bacillus timonensis]|nr:methyl-accepting chemotaxis protein [Bacillus timonensis]